MGENHTLEIKCDSFPPSLFWLQVQNQRPVYLVFPFSDGAGAEEDLVGPLGLRMDKAELSGTGMEKTLWTTTSTSCSTQPAWPSPSIASRRERQCFVKTPGPPKLQRASGTATWGRKLDNTLHYLHITVEPVSWPIMDGKKV